MRPLRRPIRYGFAGALFAALLLAFGLLLHNSSWEGFGETSWSPFSLPLEAPDFPFDVRPEAPAGGSGFVDTNQAGHFVLGTGERIRFWGVGVGQQLLCPTKETAERLADRLAAFGVNLVRVQGLDAVIFDSSEGNTRSLNAEKLDRFDYLVAQLKERGIYVDLVLIAFRQFRAGDGVVDWSASTLHGSYEKERLLRSTGMFDPQVLELHREYAEQLLQHRNPYTGGTYANEPAVAMIEIINETTLLYGWLRDYLNAASEEPTRLTAYYSRELDVLWNLWLQDTYVTREALEARWEPVRAGRVGLLADEDPAQGTVRRTLYTEQDKNSEARSHDLLSFYADLERTYFVDFASFLRNELGVRVPISGTHTFHGMAGQPIQAELDFVGMHVQWQHPILMSGQTFNDLPFRILNTPMVRGEIEDIPYRADWIETKNTLARVAYSATAEGKPLLVSEYNHAFPNEYRAEFPLLLAAYASLQDWDGVVLHEYGLHEEQLLESSLQSPFAIANDPAVMTQLPVAAMAFRHGDIVPAERTERVAYNDSEVAEAFLRFGLDIHAQMEWIDAEAERVMVHGICNQYVAQQGGEPSRFSTSEIENPFRSDTGELSWDLETGYVLIDTDRVQAAVGAVGGRTLQTADATFRIGTDFAAVSVISLDGEPIPVSSSLLLTAISRAQNTGMTLKRDHLGFYLLEDWGTPPILIEDVRGTVQIRRASQDLLQASALGADGSRISPSEIRVDGEMIELQLGATGSCVWTYLSSRVDSEGEVSE